MDSSCALAAKASRMLLLPGVFQSGRDWALLLYNLNSREKHWVQVTFFVTVIVVVAIEQTTEER